MKAGMKGKAEVKNQCQSSAEDGFTDDVLASMRIQKFNTLELTDIAASIHLQIAIVLQVVQTSDAEKFKNIFNLINIMRLSTPGKQEDIRLLLQNCCLSLSNQNNRYKLIKHLDCDALQLALDCLIDYINPRNIDPIHEGQPWRFFLARIGIIARNSKLDIIEKAKKIEEIKIKSESISDYMKYLYLQIDSEQNSNHPDMERIIAIEQELERLQNSTYRPYRLWRHVR